MANLINKLENDYIRVLLSINNGDVEATLSSIDIEDIKDKTTRIICRTILGSIEALNEHLEETREDTASISQ